MKNTNLFRFVTVRTPQKFPESDRPDKFIVHDSQLNSHFMTGIQTGGAGSGAAKSTPSTMADLLNKAQTFSGIDSSSEIISEYADHYELGIWAAKTKVTLTYQDLNTQIGSTGKLNEMALETLWDNLFYQRLTGSNSSVSDAILYILRGNHLLKAFTDFNLNFVEADFTVEVAARFNKIANSIVVLPAVLAEPAIDPEETPDDRSFNNKPLLGHSEAHVTAFQIKELETAIQELDQSQRTYRSEVKTEFDLAWKTYEDSLKVAVQGNYQEDVVSPESPESLPPQNIAEFEFTPSQKLDAAYLNGKVAGTTLGYFTKANSTGKSVEDVVKNLEEELSDKYRQMYKKMGKGNQVANLGNAIIPLETLPPKHSFVVKIVPSIANNETFDAFITVFQSESAPVAEVSISFGEGLNAISHTPLSQTGSFVTFQLFAENPAVNPANELIFSGELTLQTGEVITLSEDLLLPNAARVGQSTSTQKVFGTQKELYGVTKLGIAVFRKVEQTVCCYAEGEVSHIENILAKEYKERHTRQLTRTETETEEIKEREVENQTDTTTADRFEMQAETQEALNEDRSSSAGLSAGLSGDIPGVGAFSTSAFANFSQATSASESNSQALTQAQEITERVLDRIVQKVSKRRTSRILREFEETNKHGFDNREGTSHVTGIYRWVDKIYENKMVNYGKRLLYEFMLPEPSRNFKETLMDPMGGPMLVPILDKPLSLEEMGIESPNQINNYNYTSLAGYYGADVAAPLPRTVKVGKAYAEHVTEPSGYSATDRAVSISDFKIPDGYYCNEVKVSGSFEKHGTEMNEGFAVHLIVGNKKFILNRSYDLDLLSVSILPTVDVLPISFRSRDVGTLNFNVIAYCRVETEARLQWQLETYNALAEAYQIRLDAYYQSVTRAGVEDITELKINPAHSRAIEKQEIKRISMELITAPYNVSLGKDHYQPANNNGMFKVNRSPDFKRQAEYAKFLEQAFDWENMAYTFFPYYWADEARWQSLFQTTNDADYLFQAFLQAGMAQAVVPVRPGFETAVLFFMETGLVWKGKGFNIGDLKEENIIVTNDLQTEEPTVEETWQSRVPTALTIVQEQSAPLVGDGLPCLCEDGTPIAEGQSLLKGKTV